MLVWLAEHLVKYYSGFNVFSYLTFRAIVSLLTALFISLWMGPRMIARLQKLSFGQVVRNDGPESHFSKRGTPTMGGIMILTAIVVSVLLWAYPSNPYVWCVRRYWWATASSASLMTTVKWFVKIPRV